MRQQLATAGPAAAHAALVDGARERLDGKRQVRACGPDDCATITTFPRSGNCYVEVDGQPVRYFRHDLVSACEHAERAIGRPLQRDEVAALFSGGAA